MRIKRQRAAARNLSNMGLIMTKRSSRYFIFKELSDIRGIINEVIVTAINMTAKDNMINTTSLNDEMRPVKNLKTPLIFIK